MTQRWVAVYSTPAAQVHVTYSLGQYQFEAFSPGETFWKRLRYGEPQKASSPLFKGYTFVKIDHGQLGSLLQIEGIQGALKSVEGKPIWIPDEVIEALRRAWRNRLFDRTQDYGLAAGTEVTITDGPLTGFVGKIKSASSKHRPRLLVRFLNRMIETEVPVDKLEKITA